MIGVSYLTPRIVVLMSTLLTSTNQRGLNWNFANPSRFARKVISSPTPEAMKPKCAGGTFWRITGSKSKTLIASFGSLISHDGSCGDHVSGSGNLSFGSSTCASAAPETPARNGLPATNCMKRRRLMDGSRCDGMTYLPWLRDCRRILRLLESHHTKVAWRR